jgi:hypothetical protein
MNKLLASSVDPEQVSLTIKGVIVVVVPIIGLVLKTLGHQLDDNTLQLFTDALGNAVVLFGSAVSAAMMVVGLFRKLFVSLVKTDTQSTSQDATEVPQE